MKLDLLTNATVVDDAMRFVSEHFNNNNKESKEESNNQKSKEPDYDEKDSDKQGEEKQEEQTGEVNDNQISHTDVPYTSTIMK
jgi:hypothetical protein